MEEAKKTKKNRDDKVGFGGLMIWNSRAIFDRNICIGVQFFDDLLY